MARLDSESVDGEGDPGRAQIDPTSSALDALRALVSDLERSSRAQNTQRAYRSAWAGFETWSQSMGLGALPASSETVSLFLAHLFSSGRRAGTVQRALVAICQVHLDSGHASPRSDPRVRRLIRGVQRRLGVEQSAKAPLSREHVQLMLGTLGNDLRGLRDRAILSLGFVSGMRRSELVELDVSDLEWAPDVLLVTVRRSKSCARPRRLRASLEHGGLVDAVTRWVEASGIETGPLFRAVSRSGNLGSSRLNDRAVARLVQGTAKRVGLDAKQLAAHSLRAGFATTAAVSGVSERDIQQTLGHSSAEMTRRYIRAAGVTLG